MLGAKFKAVTALPPLIFTLSIKARRKAPGRSSRRATARTISVFFRDIQNSESCQSLLKLSRPINVAAPIPVYSVRL
ncbi:hypothetical protein D3C81_2003070 [compost metagenome]